MVGPKSDPDEDAILMERFVRTRDRRVFEVLFQKYKRPMISHALRFVRDQARAEELTQDVFVRLYTTKKYEPSARFKTWLYTVATRVCLNEIRKAGPRGTEVLDEEPVAEAASPEDAVAGRELADALGAALARLPTNQRAALLMARQDGLTHEEIAAALESTVPAVKSLIHRALETLRKEVERLSTDHSKEVAL